MDEKALKALKSGTDIRGTAIEGEKGQPVTLTDEAIAVLIDAFVVFLARKTGKTMLKVAVGHDSRLSASDIMQTVSRQISAAGCTLYRCGLCSTPSMFMMTQYPQTECDGAIMITASHHPYNKNGLKFFTRDGGLDGRDIDALIDLALGGQSVRFGAAQVIEGDFMAIYSDMLVKKVQAATKETQPLQGLKIVVDAGNGAGGFYADRVLLPLGADVSGSQFLEPDGRFPNHVPNPEDATAMHAISQCVKQNKADLGIIFDTDVDRAAIVASSGEEINRNRLIALIGDILLREHPGCTIVTDSVTSEGLGLFIACRGGVHHRYKRGYRNVIDEAVRLNQSGSDAQLAIETSGHAALKENYFLDDGAYLVTRILMTMAQLNKQNQKIESLIADLKMAVETREVRLSFTTADWKNTGKAALEKLTQLAQTDTRLMLAPNNYEGVRANYSEADGWFLARMSVHDPILPINIESDRVGGAATVAQFLYAFFSQIEGIDATPLR